MADFSALGMTEIIRLQSELQEELARRFQRPAAVAFSDIVGSTAFFARFGDAAGRQLQQLHLDLLGQCLPRQGGRVVDTAGDGAFVAFAGVEGAIGALLDLHHKVTRANESRSRDHQLRLRIGVHWGPVLTDGVAVTGESVNLCARVAASAEPGEIRLTRETFQELGGQHRLKCRSLGVAELKGVARQVELMVMDWRDARLFPTTVRIEETREERRLPDQDIISFGRLREHEGSAANDFVLTHPDPDRALQISRWQFELRRFADGFRVRPLSDGITEVDGVALGRNDEAAIRPGSKVRVARVLTLEFLSPSAVAAGDASAPTRLVT